MGDLVDYDDDVCCERNGHGGSPFNALLPVTDSFGFYDV